MLLYLPQPPWAVSCARWYFGARLALLSDACSGRERFNGRVDVQAGNSSALQSDASGRVGNLPEANDLPAPQKAVQHPGRLREVKQEPRAPTLARRNVVYRGGGHVRSRPGCCAAERRRVNRTRISRPRCCAAEGLRGNRTPTRRPGRCAAGHRLVHFRFTTGRIGCRAAAHPLRRVEPGCRNRVATAASSHG